MVLIYNANDTLNILALMPKAEKKDLKHKLLASVEVLNNDYGRKSIKHGFKIIVHDLANEHIFQTERNVCRF